MKSALKQFKRKTKRLQLPESGSDSESESCGLSPQYNGAPLIDLTSQPRFLDSITSENLQRNDEQLEPTARVYPSLVEEQPSSSQHPQQHRQPDPFTPRHQRDLQLQDFEAAVKRLEVVEEDRRLSDEARSRCDVNETPTRPCLPPCYNSTTFLTPATMAQAPAMEMAAMDERITVGTVSTKFPQSTPVFGDHGNEYRRPHKYHDNENRRPSAAVKKPASFSGRKEEWIAYRKTFCHFARSTGVADGEIAELLLSYLQPAEFIKVEALRLSKSELADITTVFDRMDRVLAAPHSKIGSMLSLDNVKQDDGSITNFAERIRNHLSRVEQTAEAFNSSALNQFIKGLDSENIAVSLIQQNIESFEKAVEIAVEWSLARSARAASSTRRIPREPVIVNAIRESQSEVQAQSFAKLQTRLERLESGIADLVNQSAARNGSPRYNNNRPNNHRYNDNTGRRRDISTVQCYRCREYGHYSNRCPTQSNGPQRPLDHQQSNQQHQPSREQNQQIQGALQNLATGSATTPDSNNQAGNLNMRGGRF